MESIKELRVKLQTNVLGHPILQRVLSIYVTRVFLAMNITANQVSAAMIVVGVISGVVIAFGYIWTGLVLIYLSLLLDAVDGEIARYRKVFSLRGIYLDLVNHLVVFGVFFLGLTLTVSEVWTAPNFAVLIAGAIGSITMGMRRAVGDLPRVLFVKPYRRHPELFNIPTNPVHGNAESAPSESSISLRKILRKVLWGLHELHEGGDMIVVLVIAYIGESLFFPGASHHLILSWIVIFYGTMSCLYLIREIIVGFYSVESRIASLRDQLVSDE